MFCVGLGFGCSASLVVQAGLDFRRVAQEAKFDSDIEGRSHLLGQLLGQFDILATVYLEGNIHGVYEPDHSEKTPARLSCDEAEQGLPRLRFGVFV